MNNASGNPAKESPAHRWPSDRFYSIAGWILLFLVAADIVAARYLPLPRSIDFRLFLLLILLFNLLWVRLADRRIIRHIHSDRRARILRRAAWSLSILLNLPLMWMLITSRRPDFLIHLPSWYAAAVMIWHIGLVTTMPLLALTRLGLLGSLFSVKKLRQMLRGHPASEKREAEVAFDASRRALLQTAVVSVPVLALGGCTAAAMRQAGMTQINRHRLPAPWLPERLRGLTITQLSDLHVGPHFAPRDLPRLVEAVNRLNSDIIVVTGDIVNDSNDMLPATMEALTQMNARHGTFLCMGNHDQIDSREDFLAFARPRLPVLIDEFTALQIGGEKLSIGAIDFARDDDRPMRPGHGAHVRAMLKKHHAETHGPLIALAHHPHAFDALAASGVPLTLSGHTHGGQIMFNPPATQPEIGLGNLLFKYNRGFYERNGAKLFVNRGVGNWFPLRINSPAEIVQIQLV